MLYRLLVLVSSTPHLRWNAVSWKLRFMFSHYPPCFNLLPEKTQQQRSLECITCVEKGCHEVATRTILQRPRIRWKTTWTRPEDGEWKFDPNPSRFIKKIDQVPCKSHATYVHKKTHQLYHQITKPQDNRRKLHCQIQADVWNQTPQWNRIRHQLMIHLDQTC